MSLVSFGRGSVAPNGFVADSDALSSAQSVWMDIFVFCLLNLYIDLCGIEADTMFPLLSGLNHKFAYSKTM